MYDPRGSRRQRVMSQETRQIRYNIDCISFFILMYVQKSSVCLFFVLVVPKHQGMLCADNPLY